MALGGAKLMWKYVKSLEYPVNIKKKDLRMAKYLVTQYGGANGELAAAFRYLNQRYTMTATFSSFTHESEIVKF